MDISFLKDVYGDEEFTGDGAGNNILRQYDEPVQKPVSIKSLVILIFIFVIYLLFIHLFVCYYYYNNTEQLSITPLERL